MSYFSNQSDDDVTISTAKEALLSKLSAIQLGYFQDEFSTHFCGGMVAPKKPPIINRGYFARVQCINAALKQFEDHCKQLELLSSQIVILGGGYDSLSLNILKSGRTDVTIFDVDFPEIIQRKTSLILSKAPLKAAVLPPGHPDASKVSFPQSSGSVTILGQLRLLPIDMRQCDDLCSMLLSSSFDPALPTLIISECVLVYIPTDDVTRLVERSDPPTYRSCTI